MSCYHDLTQGAHSDFWKKFENGNQMLCIFVSPGPRENTSGRQPLLLDACWCKHNGKKPLRDRNSYPHLLDEQNESLRGKSLAQLQDVGFDPKSARFQSFHAVPLRCSYSEKRANCKGQAKHRVFLNYDIHEMESS